MRTITNVTNTIDTVAGICRDIVAVVTRNVGMWQDSVRHLHLAMRRAPGALAGSLSDLKQIAGFKKPKLQPAYALAYAGSSASSAASLRATAGSVRRERRVVRPSSLPSVRVG